MVQLGIVDTFIDKADVNITPPKCLYNDNSLIFLTNVCHLSNFQHSIKLNIRMLRFKSL